MSHIIAIAGPVGSGKSSLARALATLLQDAPLLSFDQYEEITRLPPEELLAWSRDGADIDSFSFPGLANDLQKLKRGEPVTAPVTGSIVNPGTYVVFEMPFGKAHAATSPYIDLLIWVDLPLDVALARKLKEHIEIISGHRHQDSIRDGFRWIHGYVDNYLLFVHDMLMIQHEKVRPGADLLIDGNQPLEAMARTAHQFVITRKL